MRLFGYARVSTSQQSLEIQIKHLLEAGVARHRIFCDKATGSSKERDGLKLLLVKIETGDVILVTKLDRLGRNTIEMCQIIEELADNEIEVRFIQEGLSTKGTAGKLLITIIAAIAQAERERINERTTEGRIEAKKRGVKFGPKFKFDREKLLSMVREGRRPKDIMKELKIGRSTIYKIIKEEGEKVVTTLESKLKKTSPMEAQGYEI